MKKLYYILFLLIFLLPQALHGQSTGWLEESYNSLQRSLKKEDSVLTVLKNSLQERVRQIENEKKSGAGKDKIAGLMSQTAGYSNRIDEQQKKTDRLFRDLENVKKILSGRYAAIIDSIRNLKSGRLSNTQQGEADMQIMIYTGRKLMVAPRLPKLSFNPEKISKIDLKSLAGQPDRALYLEYIKKALSETERQLAEVNETYKETGQIVNLNKKMKRFLEESEFESGVSPAQRYNRSFTVGLGESPDANPGGIKAGGSLQVSFDINTAAQVRSYSSLLRQLNPDQASDILSGLKSLSDYSAKRISLNEYYSLLKELKHSLEEYKNILLEKTRQVK